MKIINLTPHDVVLSNQYQTTVFKKSEIVFRVDNEFESAPRVAGFRLSKVVKSQLYIQGRFTPNTRNMYIVSIITLNAFKSGEIDLPKGMRLEQFISPDTKGPGAVKDEKNRVISVAGFIQ